MKKKLSPTGKKIVLAAVAVVLVLALFGFYELKQAALRKVFYYFKVPQNDTDRAEQGSAQVFFARFPFLYDKALVLAAQDVGMNPFQRTHAIEQLAVQSIPPHTAHHEGVIAGLLEDKTPEIRVAALDALFLLASHGLGDRVPLGILHPIWENDQDFIVQFHVCRLLVRVGSKTSIEPLRWKLNLNDERVRVISTVALYSMTGEKNYLNSLNGYLTGRAYQAQSIALFMMGETGDLKMIPLLKARLHDRNPVIRRYAKNSLEMVEKAQGHS